MGARGGGQEATMLSFLGVIGATKPQMVTGHWPHLPRAWAAWLCWKEPKIQGHPVLRKPTICLRLKASHDLDHSRHFSQPQLYLPYLSSQPNWWALISCYFRPLCLGREQAFLRWPTNRHGEAESREPGAVWVKRREVLLQPQVQWMSPTISLRLWTLGKLWTLEASSSRSRARSESELTLYYPQQIQRLY